KKQWQAAWLLRAIACMDLTSLSGDDTPGTIRRLCAKAKQPVREDLLQGMGFLGGMDERKSGGAEESEATASSTLPPFHLSTLPHLHTAAVCVYQPFVETAVRALESSGIPVASVAAGFPHGLSPLKARIEEIRAALEAGAEEIDIVITRFHVLNGEWSA